MKIAFLFGIFPDEIYLEILTNSKGVIQYAADALQKSFIEGICSLIPDIEIFNLPYIGSYPLRYKRLYSPKAQSKYTTHNGNVVSVENIRFCNLTGIKMFCRYNESKYKLDKWCKENDGESKLIIVYAVHTPFLKACVDLKKKYGSSLKILLIVPDLPQYMGSNNSYFSRFIHDYNRKMLSKLYYEVDSFVLLSKYMKDILPVGNKKWTVVEGIFNNIQDDIIPNSRNFDLKLRYIFYSGTLAKRYGVLNLVEAFCMLKDPNYRLVICGAGNAENEIIDYARRDNRIQFMGQIPRIEVLKLQRQASLLVNPRTPEGEFTKYSFPSKTMEYLVAGVPVLLYKLPGIPEEYYQYCFALEDLGVEALANKITDILSLNIDVLEDIGSKARKFIIDKKTPIAQCEKVVELINSLK